MLLRPHFRIYAKENIPLNSILSHSLSSCSYRIGIFISAYPLYISIECPILSLTVTKALTMKSLLENEYVLDFIDHDSLFSNGIIN